MGQQQKIKETEKNLRGPQQQQQQKTSKKTNELSFDIHQYMHSQFFFSCFLLFSLLSLSVDSAARCSVVWKMKCLIYTAPECFWALDMCAVYEQRYSHVTLSRMQNSIAERAAVWPRLAFIVQHLYIQKQLQQGDSLENNRFREFRRANAFNSRSRSSVGHNSNLSSPKSNLDLKARI